MEGGEHLAVQLLNQVHGLECKVETLQGFHARVECHRHAAHDHIFGLGFSPTVKVGLEPVAMDTGIGEEFQHLYLPSCRVNCHRLFEPHVVHARFELARRLAVDGPQACCTGDTRGGQRCKLTAIHF